MRRTKITAFIALTAVSAFLLVLSFTPPAGGETHSAPANAPADVQMTSAPAYDFPESVRLEALELLASPLFDEMSSAGQMRTERMAGARKVKGIIKRYDFAASSYVPVITDVTDAPNTSAFVDPLTNDPTADTTARNTQSETSIVLGSGTNVVSAFNDSGSNVAGANKFTGFSTSANSGTSWTDRGTLPTAAGNGDAGDPILARNNTTGTIMLGTLNFNVAGNLNIYRSTDQGVTFGGAINGTPGGGSQDKEWLAVDNFAGAGNGNGYLFWRNFAGGGGMTITRSTDDGLTWGNRQVLAAASGQGAQVAVGPDHSVYCQWFATNQIVIRRSTDQGLTFAPLTQVTPILSTGVNGDLALGAFRSSAFPQLVVNQVTGTLYTVYPDNPVGADRADVFFRQSTDNGATWSAAVRVNSDPGTNDNWMPTLAVTPDGTGLFVGFYDRRRSATNNRIEYWGRTATISGSTVTFGCDFPISSSDFPVVVGVDPAINSVYMGDYDQAVANNTHFYVTWGDNRLGNPDVRFALVPKAGATTPLGFSTQSVAGPLSANSCSDLTITIRNDGCTATGGPISGTLSTSTPGVSLFNATQNFGTIAGNGGTGTSAAPFQISLASTFACGTTIAATLTLSNGDVIPISIPTQGLGYTFTTSTGPLVPGTTNIGNSTDDGVTFVALPFTFNYYGVPFTGVNASSNGNLQFTSTNNQWVNTCPLPFAAFTDPIMPHWDDQRTDRAGGGIFTSTSGVAPNRIFNIEWRTVTFDAPETALSYEVRLYETTGQIDFVYANVTGNATHTLGSSATVGLQKGTGAGGPNDVSTFSCNAPNLVNGQIVSWLFTTTCPQGSGPCLGGTPAPTPTPGTPTPTPPTTPSPTIPPSPTATATATVAPSASPSCAPVVVSYSGAPVAIPDSNTTGVNLVVAVAGVGTISDLDFRFDGTVSSPDPLSTTVGVNHSWVGDMIFRLTSPGGTTVTFYDRPGVPASTFGCSSNNLFALTIDDEAGSALEGQCPGGTDAGPLTGTFSGNNPLAAFDGQNPNGNWTLTAIDAAGGDTGTVRAFSLIFGGACGTPPPPTTATPTPTATPGTCPSSITHSSSQAITPLNSVSCNNASGHTDNSYWRAFNMATFIGGQQYNVTSVSFGVEEATGAGGTQPVTVRLYTNAGGAFPAGTRTQIATTTVQVLDSASGTVLSVPIVATVPAGTSELVMEVFTPNGQATGNFFFIGSNTAAETGPSYLSAADCGIANPTDTATIGFPDMNIVFNVFGSCPAGTPPPVTATPTPSATPTCPPNWSAGANFPAVGVIRAVGAYFPTNGMFYAMGGRTSDTAGSDLVNPFEYDPALNTWTMQTAAYPDNQVNNMACGVLTVSGTPQIVCVGGSAAGATTATARVFIYDPVADTMSALTAADNWPGNASGIILPGGFAVVANKLYIIGGFQIAPAAMIGQTWEFDPNAAVGSRWLQRMDFPVTRGYVPAAAIGGSIYTAGGFNTTDGGTTFVDSVESFKFDVGANTWSPIANIPRATGETRAVVMNGEMWVLGGGRVAPNPGNQVDIYNPGTDTWSAGLPFTAGRRNFPADSDGTARIWLAGGYDATPAVVNTMQVFGPGVCPTPPPGTPTPTPTPTPSIPPTPPPGTPTPTVTPGTPTPTPPESPTPTPGIAPPAQAVNFSTRMFVRTGDGVGIGGFIVGGSDPKRVILRAIGPTLASSGITDFLPDPVLELHGPTGFTTVINNNWRDTQEQEIQDTGIPPTNDFESAIVATLAPGNYTGVVRGNGNTTGVALIEVYDLDLAADSRLANISTRAFVSTGDDIVIAGFILGNNSGDDRVIVRGLGPSLSALGVPTVLANPTLDMRNANGTLVFTNNDWQDNPAQATLISGAGLAPSNAFEAAIAATLPPDLYTVLLAGLNKGTGNGLVEVYDLGDGTPFPTPTPGLSPTPSPIPTASPGGTPVPTPSPGASPSPSPVASPSPSPSGPCEENFDGQSTLPPGWTETIADGPPPPWAISTTSSDSPPNNAFVSDTAVISDKRLDSRPIAINSAAAVISFRNNYDFEFSMGTFWDGGVLEVSINGGPFVDVTHPTVSDGTFVSGGYNGTIDSTADNPLSSQPAWASTSGGYITSTINLIPALQGQSIVLRWRCGTDQAEGAPGWHIDSLTVTGGSCPP